MLIFILIDVQYLHNDLFSFEKGLIHTNHSLIPRNPIINPPSKIPLCRSLLSIWKTLIHFSVFIVSTIYVNNDTFEDDLFFLYRNDSCLLYQHMVSKKIRWKSQRKIIEISTNYPETESEIEEKTTKQPWFLDCHQLFLSMFCRIVILSWTSTLHRKKAFCIVKYSILKQN